jgi:hypothetical protein
MVRRLAIAILVAATCAVLPACALRKELSRDEIQAKLGAQFPIEKAAGLWAVRIQDPVLHLDGPNNRVGLELGVVAAGLVPDAHGAGIRSIAGRAGVEGRVEYRSEAGAFYLRDPAVTRLELTDVPIEAQLPLRIAAEAAIQIALRDRPIYVLDPKRGEHEALIKGHLRRVWVEGDRLVVEYHL